MVTKLTQCKLCKVQYIPGKGHTQVMGYPCPASKRRGRKPSASQEDKA